MRYKRNGSPWLPWCYYRDLVLGQALYLRHIHQNAVGYLKITELCRNLYHVFHAPPGNSDAALMPCRGIYDLLYAVYIGRKGGDDYALLAAVEMRVNLFPDRSFGNRIAGIFNVGRVGEHGRTPCFPSSPSLARSIISSEIGVVSIL